MNIEGILAGLGYWILSMFMAYYLLIQPNKKVNICGMILLTSTILIPALVITASWPTMVDHFIALLVEYPLLNIPLFIIVFIICALLFKEASPGIMTPTSEKAHSSLYGSYGSSLLLLPLYIRDRSSRNCYNTNSD